MARAAAKTKRKAETLYRKGLSFKEIAERIGVTAQTVRRWRNAECWDDPERKKREASKARTQRSINARNREPDDPLPPTGAPEGNVNAVGHRSSIAPGNKHAWKHGAYSAVSFSTLSAEEQELVNGMDDIDPEEQLIMQLQLFTVSERRMMHALKHLSGIDDADPDGHGLFLSEESREQYKRDFKDEKEEQQYMDAVQDLVNKGERLPGESYKVTTVKRSTLDTMTRIQQQLTNTQSKKLDTIRLLYQIREDRRKHDELAAGSSAINAWIESLLEIEQENLDGEDKGKL